MNNQLVIISSVVPTQKAEQEVIFTVDGRRAENNAQTLKQYLGIKIRKIFGETLRDCNGKIVKAELRFNGREFNFKFPPLKKGENGQMIEDYIGYYNRVQPQIASALQFIVDATPLTIVQTTSICEAQISQPIETTVPTIKKPRNPRKKADKVADVETSAE